VAPGSCYSNCVAIHAELNALLYCDRSDLPGSTLYVTRKPCYGCMKAIYASGVSKVVSPGMVEDFTLSDDYG
jgi:deoxycytidylate deaminase